MQAMNGGKSTMRVTSAAGCVRSPPYQDATITPPVDSAMKPPNWSATIASGSACAPRNASISG